MNKSILLASVVAVMSISGAAMALKDGQEKTISVPGLHGPNTTLGTLTPHALGREGQFCLYLADWESPYNPNDIRQCELKEFRTIIDPSCIKNEERDFVTSVVAGGMYGSFCEGFNIKGEDRDDVALVLGESEAGLNGVAIVGGYTVYPVLAADK